MTFKRVAASLLLASVVPSQPVLAQVATIPVAYGGGATTPVAQNPVDPKESPEEMAKDAARDLRDNRFYNKPGATRAQYDADWQRCRLIARGSQTPAGTVPMYYNPAYVSPLAAGIGAGIGGAIAAAIQEGQQRRDNRRNCLLIGGWRLVELPAAETARIAAMTDEQRSQYFNTIVGAKDVSGKVTERTSFSLPPDANLHPEKPLQSAGSLSLTKKEDPATVFNLAPGEAAVVLAYRRVEPATDHSATVELARYDAAASDLVYQPKDWKKKGDKTTYDVMVGSFDRKSVYEVRVLHLTAGDYVIKGTAVGVVPVTATHCFGAPTFHVAAGEFVYLGDFIPYMGIQLAKGDKLSALAYANHIEDARAVLVARQPAAAAALKLADLHNQATFACSGVTMTRWDIEGLPALPKPSAPAETAAVAPAAS